MTATALTANGQPVTMPVLPTARNVELADAGVRKARLVNELPEACRPLVASISAELTRLRTENVALRAENAVLHDEVQSLDHDLAAAREGRTGGDA